MATRGFTGRRPAPELADRFPPGQSLTEAFPVLSAGPTPRVSLSDWSFTLKVGPRPGVRPFRWTASCCGFDQALGVLILEVDGAVVAES
jgi:hypothetical protein